MLSGGKQIGRARKLGATRMSGRGTGLPRAVGRHALRHLVQVKKEARDGSVRHDL